MSTIAPRNPGYPWASKTAVAGPDGFLHQSLLQHIYIPVQRRDLRVITRVPNAIEATKSGSGTPERPGVLFLFSSYVIGDPGD